MHSLAHKLFSRDKFIQLQIQAFTNIQIDDQQFDKPAAICIEYYGTAVQGRRRWNPESAESDMG